MHLCSSSQHPCAWPVPLHSEPCSWAKIQVGWFCSCQKPVPLRSLGALAPSWHPCTSDCPFLLPTLSIPFFFTSFLVQTIFSSLQATPAPLLAFKTLKLTLELFLLCFSFVPFLVCLFSPILLFLGVVCGVFLALDYWLGFLIFFSFCLMYFWLYV